MAFFSIKSCVFSANTIRSHWVCQWQCLSSNKNKNKNVNEFQKLIEELEFEPEDRRVPEVAEEVESEDEEEEDVQIKYPYERKDAYQDLQERIERRLNDSGDEKLEQKAKELQSLIRMSQSQWKVEQKQQLEDSLLKPHTAGSIFTCVMCSKAFPNAEALQIHTDQVHDLSRLKHRCKLCGKAYKRKKNLDAHMALHLKEIQCDNCSLVFQSEKSLQSHIIRHHQEDADELEVWKAPCSICKELFPSTSVKTHEWYCKNREKIIEKQRVSKILKVQSLPSSPALSTVSYASFSSCQPGPITSPVSYRDKSCQVCGESFASRQSMLRHVGRKHPDAKNDPNVTAVRYISAESPKHPYACIECGKRFTTVTALSTHKARVHSQSNRFECTICHKSYPVPSELRKHIKRVHEKDAPKSRSALEELPEMDDIF